MNIHVQVSKHNCTGTCIDISVCHLFFEWNVAEMLFISCHQMFIFSKWITNVSVISQSWCIYLKMISFKVINISRNLIIRLCSWYILQWEIFFNQRPNFWKLINEYSVNEIFHLKLPFFMEIKFCFD